MDSDEIIAALVMLWAVIDPIGTVPVFVFATKQHTPAERRKIARTAALTAAGILLFFIIIGEVLLKAMGVPLTAFQISGGLIDPLPLRPDHGLRRKQTRKRFEDKRVVLANCHLPSRHPFDCLARRHDGRGAADR